VTIFSIKSETNLLFCSSQSVQCKYLVLLITLTNLKFFTPHYVILSTNTIKTKFTLTKDQMMYDISMNTKDGMKETYTLKTSTKW